MTGPLPQEQIDFFKTQGYLVLRNEQHQLVSPVDLKAWTEDIRNWPLVKGKWMPYNEINADGGKQLMRTENYVEYHPQFHQLLCGDGIASILKQLSGEDMLLFKDKINYKSVRANGFKPHIDAPGYDHVGKIEHLTANFAVDPANAENGCLEVVPGSHKMEVDLVHVAQISDAWEAAHEWVPVNLEAGDLLLFGSFLAHRSKPNLSEKPRASIYATYHGRADGEDLRQKYYAHRRIAFPPDHEREDNKDYQEGVARYASAGPFAVPQKSATSTVQSLPKYNV